MNHAVSIGRRFIELLPIYIKIAFGAAFLVFACAEIPVVLSTGGAKLVAALGMIAFVWLIISTVVSTMVAHSASFGFFHIVVMLLYSGLGLSRWRREREDRKKKRQSRLKNPE